MAVADDRNWVALIKNEHICADQWEKDWGFLGGGVQLKKENAAKLYTVDDRIRAVQEELEKLENVNIYTKTSAEIGGKKEGIEIYQTKDNNIHKNPDLMAGVRKLPKGWKKDKWKAPADEFDPLKNLFKKK